MPWAKTDPMSERLQFVRALRKRRTSFVSLCMAFGVSPKTGYKWVHQFESFGIEGLKDRSRRPKGNSRAMPLDTAKRLVALREDHPTWGPRKLLAWLGDHEPQWELPAASTLGELLKKRGLVKRRKRLRHQPPRTAPFRHATAPNAVWAMDFKGWFRLGDGSRCDPFTVTDGYSRYLICCDAGIDQLSEHVWKALVSAFREHGLPEAIRSDNGQPWVAPKGSLGITKLGVNLLKLGIALERIDPGKPHQNGRHERFHLTLKQDTASPPARTLRSQQTRFDAFRREYNQERPHEAIGMKAPVKIYVPSPRPLPTKLPEPEYPRWYQVCSPNVAGATWFRGARYFISTALRGERVGLAEIEEDCFEVYFGKHLIGRIHTAHPELGMIAA
jgi:transposase InsO family protein